MRSMGARSVVRPCKRTRCRGRKLDLSLRASQNHLVSHLDTCMTEEADHKMPTNSEPQVDLVKTPMLIIGNQALHVYNTLPCRWTSRVYIPVDEFLHEGEFHA